MPHTRRWQGRENRIERQDDDVTQILGSFRRKATQPWPDPQHSLGKKIEKNDQKTLEKVWVAKGPASQLFETEIRPRIGELLQSIEIPQESPLLLALYMIGTSDTSAQPVIMICCYDEKIRRKVESVIRESYLLQHFPQMGLGSIESPLELNETEISLPEDWASAAKKVELSLQVMPWHRSGEDFEFMNSVRLGGTTLLGDTTLLGGGTTLVDSSTNHYPDTQYVSKLRARQERNYKATHIIPEQMEGSIEGIRGVGTRFDGTSSIMENMSENDNLSIRNSGESARKSTRTYAKDLAETICQDLSLRAFDDNDILRVSNSLPHILHIFAFKVAKEKASRKYRRTINVLFEDRSSFAAQLIWKARDVSKESTEQCSPSCKSSQKPHTVKVDRWLPRNGAMVELPPESGFGQSEPDWSDNEMSTEHEFLELVTQSRAYKWLISKLRSELGSVNPTGTAIARLSEAMFAELNENHRLEPLSRETTLERINAVFHADWSPHSFLKEQDYGVSPEEAIVKALVLVGTKTQAEGLACGEYLSRQWPDSAQTFTELLQSVVKSAEGTSHEGILPDDTTLQASVKGGHFSLRASGYPDSVVEIGEQLMWIGCALRSSEFASAGTCQPSFAQKTTSRTASCISMHIALSAAPKFDNLQGTENGACWQGLFRNPLVVEGFPIPRHQFPDSVLGLQLSLSTLMTLLPNSRIVPYMGKLFIKRFSALLIAVNRVGNVILWHAISNKDGSYVYYHDERVHIHDAKLDSSILQEVDIAKLKHVVGWTSMADNSAGTMNCNYRIKGSGQTQSLVPELELERITIGFSKFATGNASVKLGWRDKSISTTQEGDYKANIKFISEKFVILYDVEDHRGFLLDGATALLYLLRASLIRDENDGMFDNRKINDTIQLHHHWDPRIQAINTLWKNENACLKLYYNYHESDGSTEVKKTAEDENPSVTKVEDIESRKGSWVLLSDRVNSILSMLDQAVNKQGDKEFKLLLNKLPGQHRLEGYDFRQLAHNDKANVQSITPGLHSKGWLDLSQKLSAVSLFGRDFGDIIRHSNCATDNPYMCPGWRCVPKKAGYLAVSNATMERVLENGDVNTWRLVDDVYMNCPQDPFRSCEREAETCARRHYLVKGQNKKPQRDALVLPTLGALIIGYESNMPFHFNKGRRSDQLLIATANGIEGTVAPGTSTGPLSSESSRSLDTTRPTISLATTESSGVRLAPTSDTTVELSQFSVDFSEYTDPSRSQPSKLPETTDSLAPSSAIGNSSAVCMELDLPGASKSKDPPRPHPHITNADSSRETSRQRSFRGWWKRVSLVRKST